MLFKCMECGKEFGQITGKHVKRHGYDTVKEYLEKYPSAQTVRERKDSFETIERKRQARLGYKHNDETKAKIGAKHTGKKRTNEEIDKWRTSYRKFLDENGSPMLGKDRGDAFKQKMSEIAKNRDPELVKEKVRLMNDARRGSHLTKEQKEKYSEARIKYMVENPDKLPKQMFNTIPEQEFEQILIDKKVNYVRSFHLKNRVFDFKINDNILIEIDGPYHRTIGFYMSPFSSDEEKVDKLMKIIQRDRDKDKLARDNSFFVYRIPVGQHLPTNWYEILLNFGFNEF